MPAPAIELLPGTEDNGLAAMIAQLIRQNLESRPDKQRACRRMRGRVTLVAEDAETSLTLRFAGGTVWVHDGMFGLPDILVRGSSEDLINLSRIPLLPGRLELPDPRTPVVRALVASFRSGRLRMRGGLRHPTLLLGLSQALNIY